MTGTASESALELREKSLRVSQSLQEVRVGTQSRTRADTRRSRAGRSILRLRTRDGATRRLLHEALEQRALLLQLPLERLFRRDIPESLMSIKYFKYRQHRSIEETEKCNCTVHILTRTRIHILCTD